MKIIECLHTDSRCCQCAQKSEPVGIVVHSTGVNQPSLARYVQPSKDDKNREELISVIGTNRYGNHWNRDIGKAVHYMIGKLADSTVGIAHTLPEEYCAWGVGSGKKGSYNYNPTAHIQFEICEDGLTDEGYFRECYNAAASLCADICRRWGWEASVIVSHREAYKKGYASNHKDIDHWLKKFGLTMEDFRRDVDALLHPSKELDVGDVVEFIGTKHYSNANKLLGKTCRPGMAVVKRIYRPSKSRHPYLLKAVSGGGSNVYGWVDEKDVKKTR